MTDGSAVAVGEGTMGPVAPERRFPSPDSAILADAAVEWRSAYVHIPFCRRRCPYCDFAVVTPDEAPPGGGQDRYVDAVVAEVAMEEPWAALDAVNFGGGTPSAIEPASLRRILGAVRDRFGLAADAEVSLEANPEDWSEELGDALLAAGFTRISWGVQSLDPTVLAALGRAHTLDQAVTAVTASRAAGFRSVSLDVIFGTPGESLESWQRTLDAALGCAPDHLSAYALTVERGTELSRAVNAGAARPDPDDEAEKYEALVAAAPRADLVHYEVSNFARPGHVCRYNLATWAQGEYVAFGLGAHGHRSGVRRRNVRRLDAYLDRIAAGVRPEAGNEYLGAWGREQERLILGLRRRAGVLPGMGGAKLVASEEGRRLTDAGVIGAGRDRIVVTRPLLTDAVSVAVLSLSPGDC